MFLQNEPEVMVGSLLALIYTHRKCVTIDKEAVTNFDIKLKEERKKAGDQVRKLLILKLSVH